METPVGIHTMKPAGGFSRVPSAEEVRGAQTMALPVEQGDPFKVWASPTRGLGVSGQLQTVADVDRLIQFLNAWKVLLTPVDEIKKPE